MTSFGLCSVLVGSRFGGYEFGYLFRRFGNDDFDGILDRSWLIMGHGFRLTFKLKGK